MIEIGWPSESPVDVSPSREDIVKWTLQGKNEMPFCQIVINSWQHGEKIWLPANQEQVTNCYISTGLLVRRRFMSFCTVVVVQISEQ